VVDAGGGVLYSVSDRGERLELTTCSFCHSTYDKHPEYKHVINVSIYSVNKMCIGFRPKFTRLCSCMCAFQYCLLMLHTSVPVLYFVIHLFVFLTHNMSHHKTSPLIYLFLVHVFVFSTHT
jgi:hypothetical protein